MRIALFEPQPRVCGVTAWTFHARAGFRALGHDADVVSFTSSGRPRKSTGDRRSGWYWWFEPPDVVGKWQDAARVLSSYDLVVLNEPKHAPQDRDAMKRWKDAGMKVPRKGVNALVETAIEKLGEFALPEYVRVLRDVKVPWVSILHAPQYDHNFAPFLPYALRAGDLRGFVEHQEGSAATGAWAGTENFPRVELRLLPYVPLREEGYSAGSAVGVAGRYVPNKGHPTLAVHAAELPPTWIARLRGSESGTLGPCYSYLTYEAMMNMGWTGEREGLQVDADKIVHGNRGDVQNGKWGWWAEDDAGHRAEYLTAYSDPVGIWDDTPVAVNLTANDFAVGIEYTMLEAMDAGALVVAPRHSLNAPPKAERVHVAFALEKFTHPATIKTATNRGGARVNDLEPDVADELVSQLNLAIGHVGSPGHREVVDWNRRVLRSHHDPRRLARRALQLVGVE